MNTTDKVVINTQDLTKTFKGVNALTSLDLSVRKNSIFGFLGDLPPIEWTVS
jgi:ABC-type multidrug transport system ATPase subunit